MHKFISINDLKVGEIALVHSLNIASKMRRRLLDMGLTVNTRLECVGKSPLGDPHAYLIRGAVIAIRIDDGKNILVIKGTNND